MTESPALRIAIDAMGGDHGTSVIVPAAVAALERHPRLELLLVGDRDEITQAAGDVAGLGERFVVRHASETVAMDEPPAQALRLKKDSSMRVALNLVRNGEAGACISAGNTGALMATARYVLKTLPGLDRPAICTALPARQGHSHMLDLGANVECSAEHLAQFAVMGSILATAVDDNPSPRVGLLNVGAEQIKGNDQVKEADRLLRRTDLNYIGYVEGNEIHGDRVDVIVCDGFVGNISLKTSEGVAELISYYLRREFHRTLWNKLVGLLALPVLGQLKGRIDPRRYNGASLLGLQSTVIKSHGSADRVSFGNAIDIAVITLAKNVPQRIDAHLEKYLGGDHLS